MRYRSLLFVPAHDERKIKSALSKSADQIILDLEDAVPFDKKHEARQNVAKYLDISDDFFVRVNGEQALAQKDAEFLKKARSLILPKVKTSDDLRVALEIFSMENKSSTTLMPLIETPQAVENVTEIASFSDKISGLIFGAEDYRSELRAEKMLDDINVAYARSRILNTARSRDLMAIDTPCLSYSSKNEMNHHFEESRAFGFDGCLLIHPNQIPFCNNQYLPSQEEVAWAMEVMSQMKSSPEDNYCGIFVVDKKIVGPPMQKHAINIIRLTEGLSAGTPS